MKALTIKEPWASLIINGYKKYEFRSWKINYRGKVLIHAGNIEKEMLSRFKDYDLNCLKGVIIGEANITDCIKVDEEFINNLIHLLGEKDNINDVTVDNGRLKFNVVDLDKVDLNGIKAIATSGVFVTGNIIKTLFKLDSQVIKQALEKNL